MNRGKTPKLCQGQQIRGLTVCVFPLVWSHTVLTCVNMQLYLLLVQAGTAVPYTLIQLYMTTISSNLAQLRHLFSTLHSDSYRTTCYLQFNSLHPHNLLHNLLSGVVLRAVRVHSVLCFEGLEWQVVNSRTVCSKLQRFVPACHLRPF